jgi:hypothetical protein
MMFKMCQYATIKDKMCQQTKKVTMKEAQGMCLKVNIMPMKQEASRTKKLKHSE